MRVPQAAAGHAPCRRRAVGRRRSRQLSRGRPVARHRGRPQPRLISRRGTNVYVKVPVTNPRRESSSSVIRRLVAEGEQVNVSGLMTARQVEEIADALSGALTGFVSLFAGRIADTGRDPVPIVAEAVEALRSQPQLELIWASPRELLNVFQADAVGCHVITVTQPLLAKPPWIGRP